MDLSRRSDQSEWMDDPAVDTATLEQCLDDLAIVNTVTLARPPTLAFLRSVARAVPPEAELSVLDVGFGQGDMLRRVARWGVRRGLKLRLDGVDLSPASAQAAARVTPPSLPITYRTGDVFDEKPGSVDVVISSLFTHHLGDDQVVRFLRWMEQTARRGWFINDLHRHPIAYYGFTALSTAAGWHKMVRHDGPISVARAFRRRDWTRLLRDAGLEGKARVRWHMPFRLCVSRLR
jgi:2-polyprenyl-3-methyl-5-hydroxy-6-metoxy-1,4-benzoquinol methylase